MVNFRKNLIQKCLPTSGTAADEDSLSDVLHNSPEADNSRLIVYTWQHVIPATERVTVYKQLLGITGAYAETKEIIAKHRSDEAFALLNGLRGLNRYSGTIEDDQPAPTPWDIAKMILISLNLFSKNICEEPPYVMKIGVHAGNREYEEQERVRAIIAITKQVSNIGSNWTDVFHISRGIFKILDQLFEKEGIVDQYAGEIRLNLMNNHNQTRIPHGQDLRVHIRSAMADLVTCERTMFTIFDKIVTGQSIGTLVRLFTVAMIVLVEKSQMEAADQQRTAANTIEEAWRAMRTSSQGCGGNRPSWPRELPRNVSGRQSYSFGEAR